MELAASVLPSPCPCKAVASVPASFAILMSYVNPSSLAGSTCLHPQVRPATQKVQVSENLTYPRVPPRLPRGRPGADPPIQAPSNGESVSLCFRPGLPARQSGQMPDPRDAKTWPQDTQSFFTMPGGGCQPGSSSTRPSFHANCVLDTTPFVLPTLRLSAHHNGGTTMVMIAHEPYAAAIRKGLASWTATLLPCCSISLKTHASVWLPA